MKPAEAIKRAWQKITGQHETPPVSERLELLAGSLHRARKYNLGHTLFVAYRSHNFRADFERQLATRLESEAWQIRHIRFAEGDGTTSTADLLERLRVEPPAADEVVFVSDLRHAFPGLLNGLNYRREYIPDNRWRLVFWALDSDDPALNEMTPIIRDAPDFWAFVNHTVELPETPTPTPAEGLLAEATRLTAEPYDELKELSAKERQQRIALRERLLADLPPNAATRADLHYQLGRLYDANGQLDHAETTYKKAIDLDPDFALTWNNLGVVYRKQQRYPEAEAAFKKAINLNPDLALAWHNLGVVYDNQQLYPEAEIALKKAIGLDPDLAKAWNGLGVVYDNQQHYLEAETAYKKAIGLDPDLAIAWHNLGAVYTDQQRYPEAETAFKKAIEIDPDFATAWYDLGIFYSNQQRYPEAETALKKAIEIDPDLALAWHNLGVVYINQQRYPETETAYKKAIDLDPDFAQPYHNLGWVSRQIGEYQEAVYWYKKALNRHKTDKNKAKSYRGLAAAYRDLGRRKEADEAMKQAVQLDPHEPVKGSQHHLDRSEEASSKYP